MTDPATVEPQQPDESGLPDERVDPVLADLQSLDSTASAMAVTPAASTAASAASTSVPRAASPAPGQAGSSSSTAEPVRYAPLESDQWTLRDDFDRGALVDRIYQIVTQDQPLGTIGVYGGWGSGKSSLMRQVRLLLEGWVDSDGQAHSGYFGDGARGFRGTVWFSAWEHQKDIDPAVALLQEARRTLLPSRFSQWRMKKLFKTLLNVIGTAGMGLVGSAAAAVGAPLAAMRLVELAKRDPYDVQEDQVRKKDAFDKIVGRLAERNERRRVVFFVDDLDRCDDAVAQRLLDDIKTYLDQEQCVFVIGVNSAQLRVGRLRAGGDRETTGEDRLAKIIQYPFYVPMLAVDQYRRHLEQTLRQKFAGDTASRAHLEDVQVRAVAELLTDVLTARSTSLREVKRLVNVFTVNHELASYAFGQTGLWGAYQPLVIAVLSAVQAFCPATFEWLCGRSDAQARMLHLFTGILSMPFEERYELDVASDPVPLEALAELKGTSILAVARKVGHDLADEARLSLYLSMWGQTHQSTERKNSRWATEWRARSDFTVRQVQHWIQGIGDNGQREHQWTDHDLRVVKLGDYWWWVLEVKESEGPNKLYPAGRPRRALLLSEGLVAVLPYTGNGKIDFPTYGQWSSAGSAEYSGVLWSESSLRAWLREDFCDRFPLDVTSRIAVERVSTEVHWVGPRAVWEDKANSASRKKGARRDPTTETVYLLELRDVLGDGAHYLLDKADLDARTEGGVVGFWWLRSPGYYPLSAFAVLPSALADPIDRDYFLWAGGRAGVRPVFWLDLES